jgi:hypothetical protein
MLTRKMEWLMFNHRLPRPPVFSGAASKTPNAPPQPFPLDKPVSTRKAAAALPQQERHPVDAAPAFWLNGVSRAARLVARADLQNGEVQ